MRVSGGHVRLTDPLWLVAVSFLIWVTLLGVLKNPIAAIFCVTGLTTLLLTLTRLHFQVTTSALRAMAWLLLILTSSLTWLLSNRHADKAVISFIGLGSVCFFLSTTMEGRLESRLLALSGAFFLWLTSSALLTLAQRHRISRRIKGTLQSDLRTLRDAHHRMINSP